MSDLDDLDRAPLRLLATDGRRSFSGLAKETGLSTSAAHQRVRRLEQRGVVTGCAARVDPTAVGLPASPAALEALLQQIRAAEGASTRTTAVLSTPWEDRTPCH